jgi:hypothetical protein
MSGNDCCQSNDRSSHHFQVDDKMDSKLYYTYCIDDPSTIRHNANIWAGQWTQSLPLLYC